MKLLALFICFYFTTLTALPSIRVIKMHLHEKCHSSGCTNNSKKKTSDNGCQKEKCILSLSFNASAFVVFNQVYNFKSLIIPIEKPEKSHYHKNFISKYTVSIWQPPETIFLLS